jgi:hypothetical protein
VRQPRAADEPGASSALTPCMAIEDATASGGREQRRATKGRLLSGVPWAEGPLRSAPPAAAAAAVSSLLLPARKTRTGLSLALCLCPCLLQSKHSTHHNNEHTHDTTLGDC